MQLYFINLMTKFTFIFLSFPPLPLFHWSHFPPGRAKQHKQQHCLTEQTYREITLHVTKRPHREGVWRVSATAFWLLSSAFSYLLVITQGRKGNSSDFFLFFLSKSPHSCGAGQHFLYAASFLWSLLIQSPTVLCPYISLPVQKRLNTLNSFLFFPSLLSSSWLRKWSLFLF